MWLGFLQCWCNSVHADAPLTSGAFFVHVFLIKTLAISSKRRRPSPTTVEALSPQLAWLFGHNKFSGVGNPQTPFRFQFKILGILPDWVIQSSVWSCIQLYHTVLHEACSSHQKDSTHWEERDGVSGQYACSCNSDWNDVGACSDPADLCLMYTSGRNTLRVFFL